MNSIEQAQFEPLYAAMLRALQLQGKAEKTVEASARAIPRSAEFFDRCPEDLTAEELQTYFAVGRDTHLLAADEAVQQPRARHGCQRRSQRP